MVVKKKKRGRPRKVVGIDPVKSVMRQYWRDKSAKYYDRHRETILKRASAEKVRCVDCERMTFDETGPYMYKCRTVSKIHTDPNQWRQCSKYEPRRRDME